MSAHKTTHELNVYLDANTPGAVSLSELIKNQFVDGVIPPTLTLIITIAPNHTVAILDDVATANAGIVTHVITCVIHEKSQLTYQLKMTEVSVPEQSVGTIVNKKLTFSLVGQHAQAAVRCAYMGTNNQLLNIQTVQDHQAQHTTSSLIIKGVLDNAAHIKAHNIIHIHKGADRSNAEQTNKNILLSSQAGATSQPQLEIEAHDVKCKHGAAVSQLSPEHLFYLQSRGLNTTASRDLLIQAFLV